MDNAAALFVDAPVEEGHGDRPALVTPAGAVRQLDFPIVQAGVCCIALTVVLVNFAVDIRSTST